MDELERLKQQCTALKAAPMLSKGQVAEAALDAALHCLSVLVTRVDNLERQVSELRVDVLKGAPL